MSYYNTTILQGLDLFEAADRAATQEQIVLTLLYKNRKLSASEIFRLFPRRNTPITSIRRALTDLEKQGFAEKTSEKRTGLYGRPEYVYRITGNGDIQYHKIKKPWM